MMTDQVDVQSRRKTLVVNAGANLVRAASGSLENLLLPLLLLLLLPQDQYGAWAVVFSVSAYVTYLDLGLQGAVQATVARWAGQNDHHGAARMAWSGTKVVLGIGIIAFLALTVVAAALAKIFPDLPKAFVDQAAAALLLLTIGQVANLGINVLSSFYAGHQRSVFPSLLMASARVTSLTCVLIVGHLQGYLPTLAIAYSAPLLLGFLVLLLAFLREMRKTGSAPTASLSIPFRGSRALHLLRYSGPLMIWNVCTLAVSAIGTAVVARVDFDAVVLYSISTMFVLAVVGVDNAVMSPLLSELGRQATGGSRRALGTTVLRASRINAAILAALTSVAAGIAAVLSFAGVVSDARTHAPTVIVILLLAAALRLTMTPLIFGFVSTGDHRKVVVQPVIEAVANLSLSVGLGSILGVTGVVLGGLISAVVGVVLTLSWSRRAAGFNDIVGFRAVLRAIVPALTFSLPSVALCMLVPQVAQLNGELPFMVAAAAVVISLAGIWFFGVSAEMKDASKHVVQRLARK